MTTPMLELARETESYVLDVRKELHRIPELRFEEAQTLAVVRREVDRCVAADRGKSRDIDIHEYQGGLVVDVTVDPRVERWLLRADVDGLPVPEQTGLPYASIHPGQMHACGHDAHTAMLLGAFSLLTGRVLPTRNLRFVWQRAEENPVTESGGAMLVREGVCEGVSRVFGLHVDANRPSGWFLSREGAHMANSDRLQVQIACQGGHVARPHHGSNAADIAVDVCAALRGFALRTLGPDEAISLVPAIVRAGTASNVRPDTAELWFAVRNFLDADRRQAFETALTREVEQVVRRYPDATVTVRPVRGHPSLLNTASEVERVRGLLQAAGLETHEDDMRFGGEDFAWYLRARPGCFWFLGAKGEGSADHHAPRFNPDPTVFWRGVHYWLLLAQAPGESGGDR
jgi:hippurate hydrolase